MQGSRALVASTVGLAAAALALVAAPATAAPPRTDVRVPDIATSPPDLPAFADRMDGAVAEVATAGSGERREVARDEGLEVDRGGIVLELYAGPRDTDAAIRRVRALGGEVGSSAPGIVEAFVPPAALPELGRAAAIARIQAPTPRALDAVTGQGVADIRASIAYTAGVTGAGVKVAIVDAGYGGLANRQAQGDLPASLVMRNFCNAGFQANTGHGTGVAEIVHEVAPQARLYLICTDNAPDLAAAGLYAAGQGVRVVNHSISYFNSSRGDGSGGPGSPDDTVEKARTRGIFWANSAGNRAQFHWGGAYNPGGSSSGFHDFPGGSEGNGITIGTAARGCVFLKWDSWPVTNQDFDVQLYRLPANTLVADSNDAQTGTQPPVDSVCFTNPGGGTSFFAAVQRVGSTSTTPRIDLFTSGTSALEHQVAAGSVTEPASAPEAVASGAFCFATDALKAFSSQGPTIDGRRKPDLSGPDAVSNGTFGPATSCNSGFTGTSASSPHTAGAAALLLEGSAASPDRVKQELQSTARDLGPPGPDNRFGAGGVTLFHGQPDLLIGGVGDGLFSDFPLDQQVSAKLKVVKKASRKKKRRATAAKAKRKTTFPIALQNEGPLLGSFSVQGDHGARGLKVSYLDAGGADVTAQVVDGTYAPRIGLAAEVALTMVVKAKQKARKGTRELELTAVNGAAGSSIDTASARIKVKVKKKKKKRAK